MKEVALSGPKAAGRVALVDDEDFCDLVCGYRWRIYDLPRGPGLRGGGVYALADTFRDDGRRTTIRMHTLITGWREVDHIDHNGLNNQRHNLRPVTRAQNLWNARPRVGSSSHFRGVSLDKRNGLWRASITVHGQVRRLGRFALETDAAKAYDDAAEEAYGEYAYLNRDHPLEGAA